MVMSAHLWIFRISGSSCALFESESCVIHLVAHCQYLTEQKSNSLLTKHQPTGSASQLDVSLLPPPGASVKDELRRSLLSDPVQWCYSGQTSDSLLTRS